MAVITVLLTAIIITAIEVPSMRKKKQTKELFVFFLFLSIGTVSGIG